MVVGPNGHVIPHVRKPVGEGKCIELAPARIPYHETEVDRALVQELIFVTAELQSVSVSIKWT